MIDPLIHKERIELLTDVNNINKNIFLIRLTKSMLDKGFIHVTEEIEQFLHNVFGVTLSFHHNESFEFDAYWYTDYKFLSSAEAIEKHGRTKIKLYKTVIGDYRISVENLSEAIANPKWYMCVQETYQDNKDGRDPERVILISIDPPTQEDIDNGDY